MDPSWDISGAIHGYHYIDSYLLIFDSYLLIFDSYLLIFFQPYGYIPNEIAI